MDFSRAESIIGYTFKDKNLLKRAFTLPSADNNFNNQTLEFFGDAILEFIVSEKIYSDNASEGSLTELRKTFVSDEALTYVSKSLKLDELLIKDPCDTNNKKAVPSVYEAVTASVYLDGGLEEARKFVLRTMDFTVRRTALDYKSLLQNYVQQSGGDAPKYKTRDVGTKQKPEFYSEVEVNGEIFSGTASSKRNAEKIAAKNAYDHILSTARKTKS